MTIHSEHPFADPPASRDPLRRFRGRLPAAVTLVTTGAGPTRTGLTVSSLMLAMGHPAYVVALVDPDSDLGVALEPGLTLAVSLLGGADSYLAEAFAGLAPAPGGVFRLASFVDTDWGPVLEGASWLGARVTDVRPLGYSLEVTAEVVSVTIGRDDALLHGRGRYVAFDPALGPTT